MSQRPSVESSDEKSSSKRRRNRRPYNPNNGVSEVMDLIEIKALCSEYFNVIFILLYNMDKNG